MSDKACKTIQLPIYLGVGSDGEELSVDLLETTNLLILGKGSAKEKLINSLIDSMVKKVRPEDVRIVMADLGGRGLEKYNGDPHLLADVQKRGGPSLGIMDFLVDEAEHRLSLFSSAKVNDIWEYNDAVSKKPDAGEHLPHLIYLIDEISRMLRFNRRRFCHQVTRVSFVSHFVGIHLVFATEEPVFLDSTTSALFDCFPDKIVFGHEMPSQFLSALGCEGASDMGENELLYSYQGSCEYVIGRLQS